MYKRVNAGSWTKKNGGLNSSPISLINTFYCEFDKEMNGNFKTRKVIWFHLWNNYVNEYIEKIVCCNAKLFTWTLYSRIVKFVDTWYIFFKMALFRVHQSLMSLIIRHRIVWKFFFMFFVVIGQKCCVHSYIYCRSVQVRDTCMKPWSKSWQCLKSCRKKSLSCLGSNLLEKYIFFISDCF